MTDISATLDQSAPPADLSPAAQALWWIAKGNYGMGPGWEAAHGICQAREGEPLFDRLHGLAHLIEGDTGNAAYWYRRVGVAMPDDIRAEWQAIADTLAPS